MIQFSKQNSVCFQPSWFWDSDIYGYYSVRESPCNTPANYKYTVNHRCLQTNRPNGNYLQFISNCHKLTTQLLYYCRSLAANMAQGMDHELMTMWLSVDPMADKYPGISPYAYCGWNPVKLVDPDGREIIIPGKTSISYSIGMSTKSLSGFQKKVVKSLNTIGQTSIGKELLTDLCNSKNKFYIKIGSDRFHHDDPRKAYKNQYISDPDLKLKYDAIKSRNEDAFEGGSGGTIFWTGKGEILPTTKGGQRNKITDLGHELFHAMDANHGRLDDRMVDGVKRSEWQAVYKENILRGQMGAPLRTHHEVQITEDIRFLGGTGPSMINSSSQPIKPSWL